MVREPLEIGLCAVISEPGPGPEKIFTQVPTFILKNGFVPDPVPVFRVPSRNSGKTVGASDLFIPGGSGLVPPVESLSVIMPSVALYQFVIVPAEIIAEREFVFVVYDVV